jgi:hypothetical protein
MKPASIRTASSSSDRNGCNFQYRSSNQLHADAVAVASGLRWMIMAADFLVQLSQETPVDFLKIDGIFVRDIRQTRSTRLVRSINELSQLLDKRTIAEFVETKEVADELAQHRHRLHKAPLWQTSSRWQTRANQNHNWCWSHPD